MNSGQFSYLYIPHSVFKSNWKVIWITCFFKVINKIPLHEIENMAYYTLLSITSKRIIKYTQLPLQITISPFLIALYFFFTCIEPFAVWRVVSI